MITQTEVCPGPRTNVAGALISTPSQEERSDMEGTAVFNSLLPAVIDTALAAAGRAPITYRWALLVESLEPHQTVLTTLGGGSSRDDALATAGDLVSLFARRHTDLGGAA